MKTAILIHGWAQKTKAYDAKYPTPSNSYWFPWLSKQLMLRDIHAVAIEMPRSFYPEYAVWKKEFERFDLDPETILVGHSCGGGFIIRWLSEHKDVRVDKVILVAPWVGNDPDQPFDDTFFRFEWDENLADRTTKLIVFNSTNDVKPVQDSLKVITKKLKGVHLIELQDKGHFTLNGMGTVEFPELLAECLND